MSARAGMVVLVLIGCGTRNAHVHEKDDGASLRAGSAGGSDAAVAVARADANAGADAAHVADTCAAIASDAADVCGVRDTLVASAGEGTAGKPTCSRQVGSSLQYAPFGFDLWRTTAGDAGARYDARYVPAATQAADVKVTNPAIGERATLVHDHRHMESQDITLYVVQGEDYLVLFEHQRDGQRPACTDDQLVDLARRALDHASK